MTDMQLWASPHGLDKGWGHCQIRHIFCIDNDGFIKDDRGFRATRLLFLWYQL